MHDPTEINMIGSTTPNCVTSGEIVLRAFKTSSIFEKIGVSANGTCFI